MLKQKIIPFNRNKLKNLLFFMFFSSIAMDLKSGTLLVPPAVKNSSCSHSRYSSHNFLHFVGIAETIEAVLILILTLGVIGANTLVIFVINNRRYSPYIHQQVSELVSSFDRKVLLNAGCRVSGSKFSFLNTTISKSNKREGGK